MIKIKAGRPLRLTLYGGHNEGAGLMPIESIVMVSGVIVVFVAFATILAIVDRTTPRVDHQHPAE